MSPKDPGVPWTKVPDSTRRLSSTGLLWTIVYTNFDSVFV